MVRLDEAQRRLVHGALVQAHGEEVGDLMMAQYAVDWSDLATKGDLAHHREVLEARIDAAVGDLRGEVRGEIGKLRGEMGDLRAEMGDLRGEMGEFRGEIKGEFGKFRGEVRGEIKGLRGEIKDAMSKQTRMFVAWNAALLLGVGGMVLGAAQLMS